MHLLCSSIGLLQDAAAARRQCLLLDASCHLCVRRLQLCSQACDAVFQPADSARLRLSNGQLSLQLALLGGQSLGLLRFRE